MSNSPRSFAMRYIGLLVACCSAAIALGCSPRPDNSLHARMYRVQKLVPSQFLNCHELARHRPIVLVAIGQSNAANHGQIRAIVNEPVTVFADGNCGLARDPLPGGTGEGGSIWSALPTKLKLAGVERPVLLVVVAVDATSIFEWAEEGSELRAKLLRELAALKTFGLTPDWLLWQQGESDSKLGTPPEMYRERLRALARSLEASGVHAPWLLALSTVCNSGSSTPLRDSIRELAKADARFRLGPDTDSLVGPEFRADGCHFSAHGLDTAAQLWSETLNREIAAASPS
jgi:hypothetical protein